MKRLSSGLAVFLSLAVAAGPAGAEVASGLTRIGVAGAVSGRVKVLAPTQKTVGRYIQSGQPLYLNEKVETGPEGHLQIMLMDETVFTIGPNSAMMLDEFVYDPRTGVGTVSAHILAGVFRFITGKVGHQKPENMKVKFPVGTMGIRGTMVAGVVSPSGATTAVLLGPGPATTVAGERIGAFTLGNSAGSVVVNRPGYGTTLNSLSARPSIPALIPQSLMNSIQTSLASPSADAAKPAGQQASADSGQPKAAAAQNTQGKQEGKTAQAGPAPAPPAGRIAAAPPPPGQPGAPMPPAGFNGTMPPPMPGAEPGAMAAANGTMAPPPGFNGAMPPMPGAQPGAFPAAGTNAPMPMPMPAMPEGAAMGSLAAIPSAGQLFAVMTYAMPAPPLGGMANAGPNSGPNAGPNSGPNAGPYYDPAAPAPAPGGMMAPAAGAMPAPDPNAPPAPATAGMPAPAPNTAPTAAPAPTYAAGPAPINAAAPAPTYTAAPAPAPTYTAAPAPTYTAPPPAYTPPPAYIPPPTTNIPPPTQTTPTYGLSALWDDVRAITSGTGIFAGGGTYNSPAFGAIPAGNGPMSFQLAVDFGNKTIGGGISNVRINAGGPIAPDFTNINTMPFAGFTGGANIMLNAGNHTNPNFNGTQINIQNSPNTPATSAQVNLNYNRAGAIANGTMNGPR